MNNNHLKRLQKVFQTVFNVDPDTITPDTTKDDVDGWDSLGHLRLMMAVEKEFGIKFTTEQVVGIERVGNIIATTPESRQLH
jgi:acyl carrier protein